MADGSNIEWTDATWNPLRGCSRISPGCRFCYAERVASRFSGAGQPYDGLIHETTKGWNGTVRFIRDVLEQPLRWKRPRRIFVNSMSDLFHDNVADEWIDEIFAVMALAPQHVFQVLTKRPERMLSYFRRLDAAADSWRPNTATGAFNARDVLNFAHMHRKNGFGTPLPDAWPLPNLWLGVSVENQATADERIPLLLQAPGAVRWLSCEPLLGPVDLGMPSRHAASANAPAPSRIDWVVAGGESGPRARPMHPEWARSLRDQCTAEGVPFFYKQWGEWEVASAANGHLGSVMPDTGSRYTWLGIDGRTSNPSYFGLDDAYAMAKVGKRKAGRLLDGRLHEGMPAVAGSTMHVGVNDA